MAPTPTGVNHRPSTLCPYHQLVVACCTPVCTPGILPTRNSSGDPEKRRNHVPHADVQVLDLAVDQREQRRQDDQHEARKHEDRDLPGDLEVLHAVAPAHGDGADAARDAGIDQRAADHGPDAADEWRSQQARQHPQDHAQRGVGDPSIQDRVQVHSAQAAEGHPRLAHQPVGLVQLDGRHEARHRADQQPHARECDEHEHREGGRRVGIDTGAGLCGVGRRCHRLASAIWACIDSRAASPDAGSSTFPISPRSKMTEAARGFSASMPLPMDPMKANRPMIDNRKAPSRLSRVLSIKSLPRQQHNSLAQAVPTRHGTFVQYAPRRRMWRAEARQNRPLSLRLASSRWLLVNSIRFPCGPPTSRPLSQLQPVTVQRAPVVAIRSALTAGRATASAGCVLPVAP